MEVVTIDGGPVTTAQVDAVARRSARVDLSPDLADRLEPARAIVEQALASGEVVYGITTGFGALSTSHIGREQAEALQVNLLRSHASGVGAPIPDELVRAMLLLRARTLAQGHSGVRLEVVAKLVEMLQRDILPVVPAQGSVGASGDLAPFAHLALPVIGEGQVSVDGQVMPTSQSGLQPISLRAKEGLSLLNGTEGMTAMGALGVEQAKKLLVAGDSAVALSVEALLGSSRPFTPAVHQLRPHPGQIASARRIAGLLQGSEIVASHADDFDHAVQDAYSLRCAPQVHGAVADTIEHVERVLLTELGSVVDNPIVLPESGEVVSAGNFHGQPIAFALDFATVAIAELASISERRTDRLLDPVRSQGLPPFLAANPGIDSGYMVCQYVQAALVAENRVLCHPASVDSIPTSGSQEDHVSMGWGAGRKLLDVIENVKRVLAIEIMCATQGIEHRRPLAPAPGTAALADLVRSRVPPLTEDRAPAADIAAIVSLIEEGLIGADAS